MSQWVRLWDDMPTDPKWRVVSRRSGRPLPEVLSVFVFMMTNAGANATERGRMLNWSDEDVGAALDIDAEHVTSIREAMQGKTLEGDKLSGWDRRQPKREDNSSERARAWREEKKRQLEEENKNERTRTQPNAEKPPEKIQSREESKSPLETNAREARAVFAKEIAEEFSTRFWPAWPHKVGKPDAAKSFLSARRKGATCDEIVAGVGRYVRDKPADRPWLNPSTFLNQRRWEDEPAPSPDARSRAGPPADRDYGKGALAKLIRNVDESLKNERLGQTEGEISGGNVLSLPVVPGVRGGGHDDDGDVSPFAQWLWPGSG